MKWQATGIPTLPRCPLRTPTAAARFRVDTGERARARIPWEPWIHRLHPFSRFNRTCPATYYRPPAAKPTWTVCLALVRLWRPRC